MLEYKCIYGVSQERGRPYTFATRFVEASNNYKYLSVMLGHSSIKITMDLYVHQTEESQALETEKYMSYTKSVGIA